ncbi:hypothetical protein EX238_21155, partial [Providencia rettgeri]|nr:hypothetical protein [Providencia rettgeri]
NCPEYKVTAVQIQRVTSDSAWQNRWNRFNEIQQRLLQGETVPAADLPDPEDHPCSPEHAPAVAKV